MKVVAVICQRNGMAYLERCLDHLRNHGVDVYLMDNASTDGSAELARSRIGHGVLHVEHVPFDGVFRFSDILRRKQELVTELDADWFMHHDVDEIREPAAPWSTLHEAIAAVDAQGYNAIEFDEFVFVPLEGQDYTDRDHVAGMRHYYHFRPRPFHRLNAWKNLGPVDLLTGFGHRVRFDGIHPFPSPFVLRHYVALSHTHVLQKFGSRVHDVERIRRTSWQDPRVGFDPSDVRLPPAGELIEYRDDGVWDRSNPLTRHPFLAPYRPPLDLPDPARSSVSTTTADVEGETVRVVVVGAPGSGADVVCRVLAGGSGSDSSVVAVAAADVAGGRLREVLEATPGLWLVHVVRDGRAVAADRLASAPSGAPASIDDLAVEWMWHIRQIRQQGQLAARMVEMRIEDFVRRPGQALAPVRDVLGTDFVGANESLVEPTDQTGASGSSLPTPERVRFERMAGETLDAFGYR